MEKSFFFFFNIQMMQFSLKIEQTLFLIKVNFIKYHDVKQVFFS